MAAYVCRRNRRKPAVDEVPSAAGFAWAIPHNSAARWTRIFFGQADTPARFLRRSFFGMAVELLEKMEIKVYNESRMMFSGERRAA